MWPHNGETVSTHAALEDRCQCHQSVLIRNQHKRKTFILSDKKKKKKKIICLFLNISRIFYLWAGRRWTGPAQLSQWRWLQACNNSHNQLFLFLIFFVTLEYTSPRFFHPLTSLYLREKGTPRRMEIFKIILWLLIMWPHVKEFGRSMSTLIGHTILTRLQVVDTENLSCKLPNPVSPSVS